MKKKNSKVISFRKPIHINIGVIIFIFIFIYLSYSVISYLTSDRIQIYEVGDVVSLSQDKTYTGLILRSESVSTADNTGYVNYYIREGNRAAVEDVVYSLDENGQFTEMLSSSGSAESTLSKENINELKKTLSSFVSAYNSIDFYKTYELKYSLENKLLGFVSSNSIEDLQNLGIDTDYFHTFTAAQSGIVEYYVDGFESLTPEEISQDNFKRNNYNKNTIRSGQLVETGSPVYKTITDELWHIMISLDKNDVEKYKDTTSVQITFPDKNLSTYVSFRLVTGTDGNTYGDLSLSRYMIQYAGQRYLDIILHEENSSKGLKIPKSAVTELEFYTIPIDYQTTGGNSSSNGFNCEVYSAEGTSVEFRTPTIYYSTDTECYVSMDDIEAGTVIAKPDQAGNTFTVGASASLKGVYNVNKGYAVFKAIEVLDENGDYYIITQGMNYGLSVYDHILLDGSMGSPGKMVY